MDSTDMTVAVVGMEEHEVTEQLAAEEMTITRPPLTCPPSDCKVFVE